MNNLEELDYLNKQSFLHEIVEKYKSCALQLDKISKTQWKASVIEDNTLYDFYFTLMGGFVVFEVIENKNKNVFSISSNDEDIVNVFFENLQKDNSDLNQFLLIIQNLAECADFFSIETRGGVKVGGQSKLNSIPLNPTGDEKGGVFVGGVADATAPYEIIPNSLEFYILEKYVDYTEFWSGSLSDLIDGDESTYILHNDLGNILIDGSNVFYENFHYYFPVLRYDTSSETFSSSVKLRIEIEYYWVFDEEVQNLWATGKINDDGSWPIANLPEFFLAFFFNIPELEFCPNFFHLSQFANEINDANMQFPPNVGWQTLSFETPVFSSSLIDDNIKIVLNVSNFIINDVEYFESFIDINETLITLDYIIANHQLKIRSFKTLILNQV